ncbi:uncharacterized protein LOC119597483 [Penaeus monodon]|uniref:uncharacterized protein LOC119597483 n=1 Tax=Penaeus monodon TaxID=6687 RepID=UPI0018A746EE|nr:uncharacterized protein LOC119597483 [Penaeus monodon]
MMSSLVDILREAQALGISPDAVQQLVEEEQKLAKDKAEREERAAERELKKLELELKEAEKRRAHESYLAELRSPGERIETVDVDASANKSVNANLYDGLRLPTFNDGQDDIDSYLLRFERLALLHNWKKEDYHVYLGSLLRGRALKVYVSLPEEIVNDYEKLKSALLRSYSVDSEMYRRKFRECKCTDKESYVQLLVRMEQYLDRWISLSSVHKSYDSLFDFMIREQFLCSCNSELRVFLKEREFSSATEMAEAADRYRSAHLYRGKALKFPQPKPFSQSRDKGTIDEIVCHACGKNGHIKPNCPDNPRNFRGVKIPNQSCPDDPSPATTDVATLTSCASPDLCEPPEEPDLCDLPNLPSSCDLTDFPDKPTFPFSTESTQVCSENSCRYSIDEKNNKSR